MTESTIVSDPTSEAAADWVVRLAREDSGEADWLAFVAWIEGAPAHAPDLHREAFDRAQSLWLAADGLQARPAVAPVSTLRARWRIGPWATGPGLATAAGLAAVWFGLWFAPPPPRAKSPVPPTLYATAPGQHRTLVLPDGSRVELDGATALALGPMSGEARSVSLLHGEVAFDVVHDPARPFTVSVGAARVRVLGTAFDIVGDPGLTQVSVSRGVVAVEAPAGSARVGAGRSAVLAGGILTVRDIDAAQVGDWRTGRRTYWDAPLSVVVADLDRTYAAPIRLGDDRAAHLRFTGVIAPGARAQTVRRLTALLPLQATTAADGAIVLSSPPT